MAQASASLFPFRKSQCQNVSFVSSFVALDDPSGSGLVVHGPGGLPSRASVRTRRSHPHSRTQAIPTGPILRRVSPTHLGGSGKIAPRGGSVLTRMPALYHQTMSHTPLKGGLSWVFASLPGLEEPEFSTHRRKGATSKPMVWWCGCSETGGLCGGLCLPESLQVLSRLSGCRRLCTGDAGP